MKINKKIIVLSLIFIFFMILTYIFSFKIYQNYKNNVNNYIYNIIPILKEKGVTEEEIITILNDKGTRKYLSELKKYGINENSSSLLVLEKTFEKHLFLNYSIVITLFLIITFFFEFKNYQKNKKIKEITNYMQEINNKNYLLNIKNNKETEISKLENEIYKMTILLRNESENLKNEKLNLKNSIEDISHQLKTPLTSISIYLDNIIDNPNMDNETKMKFINNIKYQVNLINNLCISLLKISRLDAGVIEFKKVKINVQDLINKCLKNLSVLIEGKDIQINLNINKNISILGDEAWEIEALGNLIKNAIEHSKTKGNIEISSLSNSVYTKITIKDYGIGISKFDLKNIFKRFYKGENSKIDSIGIGLNLAKKIIEIDNGIIEVNSVFNEGTTFIIKYFK